MTTLEEKLGYEFRDPALLENALTHSSCANESRGRLQSNERLEFLGDSILGMVVADHLYRNHPDLPEGELTTWARARRPAADGSVPPSRRTPWRRCWPRSIWTAGLAQPGRLYSSISSAGRWRD